MTRDAPVLAVDVGGTKFAVGMVDADGEVYRAARAPTPPTAGSAELWRTLSELVDHIREGERIAGVGIGCGGPMTWPRGEVSPLNLAGWRDFPLRAELTAKFPGAPVRIHNDAICVAIAEHWRGAGRGSANMLGMVVSTGVGGGLILGGKVIDGGTGNAGHIGHVIVEPEGVACGCGGRGCLEAVARGPALAAWALDQGWRPTAPEMPDDAYREYGSATARRLAADAIAGDEIALSAMARAGHALGLAIASASHLCDLDVVTIGGGVSQAGHVLFGPLDVTLREHARMDFARRVRVVPAALGQDAGLVGAAALVLAGDRYWSPGEAG
ncbi:glucokinase [Sinosporangium album]|uniref:Glucokinase n=1 Tax=Sinosporangium album TaxID=504805 RepID=A0A1G8ANG3_9ACTN|nr:ROK family protein [Sinosporangium album]SDH21820.1 glucokinase [Sinosporangium album]